MLKMGIGSSQGLLEWMHDLHAMGHPLESILPAVTTNISSLLRLPGKGGLVTGQDADMVCLDQKLNISHVMAGGRWMVRDGIPLVKGRFEDN